MARATPANFVYLHINDDEGFEDDRSNYNDEEQAMLQTAEALIDLHNTPLVFGSSSGTAKDKMGVAEHPKWFTDLELDGFLNVERIGEDVVEVVCACTSQNHGDYQGKLRVFRDGELRVDCECAPGCDIVDATPWQFVSHTRARRGPGQWPSLIWVHDKKGVRRRIYKTLFLRYFRLAGMRVEKRQRDKFHKDEFLKCSACGVERRFKLTTDVRCRAYHDATLMEQTWTCSMHPFVKIDCNNEPERESRKLVRGCPAKGTCDGCPACTCTGCHMCRYPDCGCKLMKCGHERGNRSIYMLLFWLFDCFVEHVTNAAAQT